MNFRSRLEKLEDRMSPLATQVKTVDVIREAGPAIEWEGNGVTLRVPESTEGNPWDHLTGEQKELIGPHDWLTVLE
jgi:hypothetical protein